MVANIGLCLCLALFVANVDTSKKTDAKHPSSSVTAFADTKEMVTVDGECQVKLVGSGSFDLNPNGGNLTYTWIVVKGPAELQLDQDPQSPEAYLTGCGDFEINLDVCNSAYSCDTDKVSPTLK